MRVCRHECGHPDPREGKGRLNVARVYCPIKLLAVCSHPHLASFHSDGRGIMLLRHGATDWIRAHIAVDSSSVLVSHFLSHFIFSQHGFDSRRYQIFWEVVGLERDPLSVVSTIEELLGRKVAAPVYKTENTAVWICHADHAKPSILKSWH
jgi:hypothetical protein